MTRPKPLLIFRGGRPWSFFGAADGLAKLFDLRGLEAAVACFLEITQVERAEFHALHFFHRMIEREQRGSQQVTPRITYFDFVPWICGIGSGRSGRTQQPQPRVCLAANLSLRFVTEFSFHLDPIDLWHARGIFENAVGESAVAREQHESRRVVIEPADGENSGKPLEQVTQGRPALGIGHRGNYMGRLVEQVITGLRRQFGKLASGFHAVVLRISFRPQLGHDNPIHAHLAAANELFGVAPRGNSGSGDNFL